MSLRSSSASSSSASPGSLILLVDDNANGVAARKSVLQELGHTIRTAQSGAEALELFGQHTFDLVVTDFKMPRMDGVELISQLRQLVPTLPVILISGFADTLGLDENSTGADAVIQKSANEVAHLVRTVNRLLKKKPERKPMGSVRLKAKRKTV
jgi:CheY-like chemotaxis protein